MQSTLTIYECPDCNLNVTCDGDDIAGGVPDCNSNGVPDDCEPDCNQNSVADSCDIAAGTSEDVDGNGVPDECETPNCRLARLVPADPSSGDQLGSPISASGTRLLVGAYTDDGPAGADQGSAYVFRRNGVTFTQEHKFVASDAAASDYFGYALSLDGDRAVIGAPLDGDVGNYSGAAYVYDRNPATGNWSQTTKLTALDGNADDVFGGALELVGDLLFVGATGKETPQGAARGKVYVLRRSGNTYVQEAQVWASDGLQADRFGERMNYENGLLAISAFFADTSLGIDAGAVYVYRQTGTSWSLEQKLTVGSGPAFRYGYSISLEGSLLAIGKPWDPYFGTGAGSVDVWKRDASTMTWTRSWAFGGPDTNEYDNFSWSVLLVGSRLFVGAPFKDTNVASSAGEVYVFHLPSSGMSLDTERIIDVGGTPNGAFGSALAHADGVLAVGGYAGDYQSFVDAGSAFAFGTLGADCNDNLNCDYCDIQAGAPDTNNNGVLDSCELVQFCQCTAPLGPCGNHSSSGGCINSNGTSAAMSWVGSTSASADDLTLVTSGMPAQKSAIMFMGANFAPAPTAFFDGRKCILSPTLRWGLSNSGNIGVVGYGPGLSAESLTRFGPSGHLAAGTTWGFQTWYRDPQGPCGDLTNLSSGVRVTFTP